jgi:hypothetical protein
MDTVNILFLRDGYVELIWRYPAMVVRENGMEGTDFGGLGGRDMTVLETGVMVVRVGRRRSRLR